MSPATGCTSPPDAAAARSRLNSLAASPASSPFLMFCAAFWIASDISMPATISPTARPSITCWTTARSSLVSRVVFPVLSSKARTSSCIRFLNRIRSASFTATGSKMAALMAAPRSSPKMCSMFRSGVLWFKTMDLEGLKASLSLNSSCIFSDRALLMSVRCCRIRSADTARSAQ